MRKRPMVRTSRPGDVFGAQHGFTYLGLLFAVVIASTALAAAGTLWSSSTKRDREAELLFVGDQFRDAIAAYHDKTPAGQAPRFPATLDDLLDDKRWPTTRRHLRRVFVDPMTRSRDWGVIPGAGGGVMGVFSKSPEAPIKHAGFPKGDEQFAEARDYRDWKFAYVAASPASGAASGVAGAASGVRATPGS